MCGIFCRLQNIHRDKNDITSSRIKNIESCLNLINSRGPDSQDNKYEILSDDWQGEFHGSVLWMQGTSVCEQPCTDSSGNILLWNGDVFSGPLSEIEPECDTKTVLEALKTSTNLKSTLFEVEGPFSFIYYQKSSNRLFFGRDKIGRHSLLIELNETKTELVLTSVSTKELKNVFEVPAVGIFELSLNSPTVELVCHAWKSGQFANESILEFSKLTNSKIEVEYSTIQLPDSNLFTVPEKVDVLYDSVIGNPPGNPRDIMGRLLENKEVLRNVNDLINHLEMAIKVRINKKPDYCKNCITNFKLNDDESFSCHHSKIGIPFSGGLDSAIIAAIADKFVCKTDSIDLINVAFERKVGSDYEVPDRITGRATYNELKEICPERRWNFVEVNITRKELQDHLNHIANLIHPLKTILDESIGCAVYFASKAKGILYPENEAYESPARVLLLGMGADELFGGYMRHRTTLRRKGWQGLMEELDFELCRISQRNLGRDDRVVADNARQARYPYLDDRLVQFASSLEPWQRCYPTEAMPCGLGEKLILRLVATKLKLKKAANYPKRAFQFGSRIANGKENARDKSARL